MTNPWQALNHDLIIDKIEETLQKKLSNLIFPRNSYINRVYELEEFDSKERLIVKFYRPGRWDRELISEEHQLLAELASQEIPVIPPLAFGQQTLFQLKEISYAIFPKKGGRAIDEFDQEGWETIGRILARIHLVGATKQSSNRTTWRPKVATKHHLEVLLENKFMPAGFEKPMVETTELLIEKAEPLFNSQELILIHGDCHKGNLIHRPGEGVFVVDFDDICLGPPVQDSWMLFPDDLEFCANELQWFLKGYETFKPFDLASLDLVPALRAMRIIHFAAWLAVQSKDTDFARHFPETDTARYWNGLIKDLQEITFKL